jgi:hypothetical protein
MAVWETDQKMQEVIVTNEAKTSNHAPQEVP